MACLLYLATALVLLLGTRRFFGTSARAACLLALLPLLFVGGALVSGRVYGPADRAFATEPLLGYAGQFPQSARSPGILRDLWSQIMPWQAAVRFALAHGEAPLMNPFILGGDVLAGAAQPAPYHPLHLAALVLSLAQSFAYVAAGTLLLAALGTFLFTRSLDCGESGALLAAAGFALSDFQAFWVGWPLGLTVATLPWVLWGARSVGRGESHGGLLTAAVLVAILAGHPETLAHILLLGALCGAFALAGAPSWRTRLARGSGAVGACAAAALLSAFFLLPVLDALDQTAEIRARSQGRDRASPVAPPAEAVALLLRHVMPFSSGIAGVCEPEAGTPIEPVGAYAGSVLLPLAALGLWRGPTRDRFTLGVIGSLSALVAAGWPGLTQLLNRLPPFDLAINRRLAFGAALAVAVLAGLGVEAIERRTMARPLALRVASAGLLVGATLLASAWHGMTAAGLPASFLGPRALVWLGVPALAVLVLARAPLERCGTLLLLLLVAQRAVERGGYYPVVDAASFFPRVPPITALPTGGDPYRVVGLGLALIPNTGSFWALEEVRGYQALHLERWTDLERQWSRGGWFDQVDDLEAPLLSLLNVRYAFAGESQAVPPGWRRLAIYPRCQVFENLRALPRAFVPTRARIGGAASFALAEIGRETDFAQRGWVDDGVSTTGEPHGTRNGPGTIRSLRHHGTGLEFDADMTARGWVIISQTAWRGWRAIVDGAEVPLRIGDYAFLALHLSAGRHHVRLYYLPRSFVAGLWVSGATLALLVIGAAIGRRRRSRNPAR